MGRRASRFITFWFAAGALGVLVTCNSLVASAATGTAAQPASLRPLVTSISPNAGPVGGGSAVTIGGARFAHVSAVFIGGKKARNVHVISASVLKAVTPAHAPGNVAITVQEKAGRSLASPVRYRYLTRPVVTGQGFLLKPGGKVSPSGLAGAVTAIDDCVAVGFVPPSNCAICPITGPAAARVTRDGWASSSAGRFPHGQDWLWTVSCMSTALCYAGPEFDGTALQTTDFGKTWKHVPDGGLSLNAASCADATTCVLGAGQAVAVTKDAGHSWTKSTISKYPWQLAGSDATQIWGLACPTPGHCVATENGWDTKNDFAAIVVS